MFRYILFISCLLIAGVGNAQVQIQGRVFDVTKRTPLESVAVLTTSGRGAITDSTGRYLLNATETDTIYFSYMGKNTNRFFVKEIGDRLNFDISIHVVANELPGVTVRSRNYLLDSIQTRKDYAKVFNYKKPSLRLVSDRNYVAGGLGAAFDLESIINLFRFKYQHRMESLQKRLLQREQDNYIDKRFSKWFVVRLTRLEGNSLDSFMTFYRPAYDFLLGVNDLELGVYIEECFKHFERVRRGEMILPPNPQFQN